MVTASPTTAVVDRTTADWERIEQSVAFEELVRAKARFIVPATAFFLIYYFALPVLVGYAPEFMSTKIIGNVNLAYLFALSQFVMTGVVVALYVRRARDFDARAAVVVAEIERSDRA